MQRKSPQSKPPLITIQLAAAATQSADEKRRASLGTGAVLALETLPQSYFCARFLRGTSPFIAARPGAPSLLRVAALACARKKKKEKALAFIMPRVCVCVHVNEQIRPKNWNSDPRE